MTSPMREGEPDLILDLQPMVDRAYTVGQYPSDYARPLDPPKEAEDVAWADAPLREAGLR